MSHICANINKNKQRRSAMTNIKSLNLNELSRLAKEDPEEFEKRRKELIEELIDSAPKELKQMLGHLQWKCDAIIQSSKAPLQSCLRMNSMLMDVFYKESGFKDKISKFDYSVRKFNNAVQKVAQDHEKQEENKKPPLKSI